MKIAFDAKRITHNRTGLGNYSRFVVNRLSELFPENEYQLYSPDEGDAQLRQQIQPKPSISWHYAPKNIPRFFWRSYAIVNSLLKEKVELYHGLTNELPFYISKKGISSIVTIHDLIFLRYPHLYKPIDRIIYKKKFHQACKESNCIVAVSEQTKRDVRDFFGIEEDKIKVIYQGCDKEFYKIVNEKDKQSVQEKYSVSDPYILYVGSIEKRKNLLSLVQAYEKLRNKELKLIAIGRETPYTAIVKSYIKEKGLSEHILLLHSVSFSELPAFYQMAKLFVYPSFFEGFGIPVLEALVSRVPVIAATGSCLEEAGGEESLYINPNNINELAGLIDSVIKEPLLASSMIERGIAYSKKFDREALTSQMMSLYKTLV